MALAPQHVIDSWYLNKNCFIYKNFDYIFKNQLWDKSHKKPGGFSVCPYFWMSILVGFLFMRLLFVPIIRIAKFITVSCFMSPIDTMLRKALSKLIGNEVGDLPEGIGFAFAFILTGAISGIAFLLAALYGFYFEEVHGQRAVISLSFWLMTSGLLALLAHGINCMFNRSSNRCKTEYYVYGWAALAVILSLAFCSSAFIGSIVYIVGSILGAIATILTGIFGVIYIAVGWIAKQILAGLTISALGIPVWAVLTGIAVVTLLLEKAYPQDPIVLEEDSRQKWENLLYTYLIKEFKGSLKEYVYLKSYFPTNEKAELARGSIFANKYIPRIVRHIANSQLKPWLLELSQSDYRSTMRAINKGALIRRYFPSDKMYDYMEKVRSTTFSFCLYDARDYFEKYLKEEMDNDVERCLAEMKEAEEKRENGLCAKFTNAISILLYPMTRGFNRVCTKLFVGIENVWTYSLVILKARKQGVCPYVMFEAPPIVHDDDDDETPSNSTSDVLDGALEELKNVCDSYVGRFPALEISDLKADMTKDKNIEEKDEEEDSK
jgi:hypothetical protein